MTSQVSGFFLTLRQRHFSRKFVQKIGGQEGDQELSGLVDGLHEVLAVDETEVANVVVAVDPLLPLGLAFHLGPGPDQVLYDLPRAALLEGVREQVRNEVVKG